MLSRIRALVAGLAALLGRRGESELDEELRFHVEELTADNLRAGMDATEARRQALIALGGVERTKEEYRDAFGTRLAQEFGRDLAIGARQLRRAPGFAAVVVLTLAVGIGATAAVFSVLEAVLLRPLPFRDQNRLVCVYGFALTTANVEQWGQASHSFDGFSAVSAESAIWTAADEPERLNVASVSKEFFPLLGLAPAAGRWFAADDYQAASPATTVVGERFWRSSLGGRSEVIGRQVVLDGKARTIVGVMPGRTPLPFAEPAFWLPMTGGGREHGAYALARLRQGVDVEAAGREALALSARLAPPGRVPSGHPAIRVLPLLEMLLGDTRRMLLVLAAAVAFVYLIACTNLANLMLARATGRDREIAIRLALGAGRLRLFRQLTTEALLLAALGTGAGLFVSTWLLQTMKLLLPYNVPRIEQAGLDVPVLALAAGLAVLAALVFGIVPLFRAGVRSLQHPLQQSSRTATDTRGSRFLRAALVVGEVSLAMVLLVGAGLLIRTFVRLRPSHPGFDPRGKLVLNVGIPSRRYPDDSQKLAFVASAMERLRALPGVNAVGAASDLPFSGSAWPVDVTIDGRKVAGSDVGTLVLCRIITPGFLSMMDTPLVAGREFGDGDRAGGPGVAIVNRSFVRRFFDAGDTGALGRNMTTDIGESGRQFTVVGVARDARIFADSSSARPEIYVPLDQVGSARLSFVVSVADPMNKASMAKHALRGDDKDVVITRVESMEEMLYASLSYERFHALLLGILAAVAVLLAFVGTYGVLSYAAGLRVREMGIRLALGAHRGQVIWLVLQHGLTLAGLGILLGTACAWALTRYMESLLIEVKPTDLATFAAAATAWIVVAGVACLVPAARAARVDPALTLRTE